MLIIPFTHPDAIKTELAGGKGHGLAKATQAGLPVPTGYILTTAAYREWFAPHHAAIDALLQQHDSAATKAEAINHYLAAQALPENLTRALAALPEADYAVRSSGSAEDLPGAAFAGLHDTLLNIRGADALAAAVKQCWLSLWNAHVLPYRERLGIAHSQAAMAVVIQNMVPVARTEAAGVAFSIDPIRGSLDSILINAAFGLGETVVAGEAPVDEYRVSNGSIIEQTIACKTHALTAAGSERLPESQQNQATLSAAQAAAIAQLAKAAEQHFGFPQDIEWAYHQEQLYLLQSRPITRFPARWTRDESAERFPNPITPLTWQLCEAGFHQSLNYSFNLMGLPPFHDKWFTMKDNYIYGNQNAVELYAGRLPLAPLASQSALEDFIEQGGLWQYTWIAELPNRWMNDLDTYLIAIGRYNTIDYQHKSLADCWAALQDINALGTRYFLPNIAISLTQTLLYRILKHLLSNSTGAQAQTLFDQLTAITDTKTSAVNQALWQLSRQLRATPALMTTRYHDRASLEQALSAHPDIATAFQQFLAQHGHRETDFDAYQPTWLEAPHTVFAQIQIMAAQPEQNHAQQYWQKKDQMLAAEHTVISAAPPKLRFFLQELLRLVRTYTALDDIEHYQTTRLTIPFRRAAREIGNRLVNLGALDDPMDIFFLDPDTLSHAIATQDYRAIRPTATANKTAYQAAQQRTPDWEYGISSSAASADSSDSWQGLGGSPGQTSGEVFIITSPEQFADFPKGAILVARTTNPAWTPLFYHASGVITESGGPLSHGAVTARELGIPAVMSIRNACTLLKNGDRVRLDGSLGNVTKLETS